MRRRSRKSNPRERERESKNNKSTALQALWREEGGMRKPSEERQKEERGRTKDEKNRGKSKGWVS